MAGSIEVLPEADRGPVHIRRRPARSPHRPGRLTPDSVLDGDPSVLTLCGAEGTTRDLSFREGGHGDAAAWVTCPACLAARAAR